MDVSVCQSTVFVDAVSLTKELIRIPSINPPGDEEACAKYLAELLAALGFETHLHTFGRGRFNLVADIKGQKAGKPIGFTGHLDTVPLGSASWSFDPFAAEEHEGKIYGRGVSDMKAGIAAFIAACAQHIERLRESTGVHLVLTGGEETGCDGARALTLAKPSPLKEVAVLIVGEPTANYPYVGHKGALWLRGSAAGKTAHGAMPERGDNAIYKATDAVGKIRQFQLSDTEHPLMGKATLNVGTFKAGLNVNSVPDHAEFEVDIRTVPGMDHGCICSRLARFLTDDISLNPIVDVPPLCTELENPIIQQIFALCTPFHPEPITPRTVPYFTDGSVLLPRTGHPPVVILGPGEPKMAHQTDEYCYAERITECVGVYGEILEQLCVTA